MPKRGAISRWRLWVIVAVIGMGTAVITARLLELQVVDHGRYAQEARANHLTEQTVTDRRGAILDRNGYPLAASQDAFDVMVQRDNWVAHPDRAQPAAKLLSQITGVPADKMIKTVTDVEAFEVPVARGLDYAKAAAVRKLGLVGVRLTVSSLRQHPEGNLAAQLVGFVGQDNTGLTGLEEDLNNLLSGNPGTLTYERDGLGNALAVGQESEVPAQPGSDVVLTIDRYIQRLAEKELDQAIKAHKASGGSIIVVQPKTGDILAMASRPTFDVTRLDLSDQSKTALYRNPALTDTYEPGSVFKLVTTAAALDQGLATPNTRWYDSGKVCFNGWCIYNWDHSANGSQTVQQMLSKSLNTGAAWLSQLCGTDRFYDYANRFGFGKKTGIGLTGEAAGKVRTPQTDPGWRPVDLATNAFGQGISATPLQVATMVATIANNGLAMKPHIVREISSPAGTQVVQPEPLKQIISPDTARTLQNMMGVVASGIARSYLNVQGYPVGGKTGTANIATDTGAYKPDAYISSFVGIAPLNDPQIAVLVKIDEPKDVPWGTVVAAPAFSHIAQAVLAYLKVPPAEEALVTKP